MRRTYATVMVALVAALLLAAGCGSEDEDETAAVQYKVLGGRLVWCSGGAEEMAVPGNASSIGNNAFSNCGTIGTLTIPASVTHIMRHTFSGVRVGKIIFGGTVGEWTAMAEQDGFGETLDGTPVICSDGEWRWTRPAVPEQPAEPDEPWEIKDGVVVRYTGSAADVTIPDGVTAIAGGAFEGHIELERVVI
ncbi:MAG: leucine-rich repeat domain-containing protein, partial [Treponemataceae bacterium]|nr:leucine-rich repeat domain-containing protein [Treponemataceae bacterium]